MINYFGYKMSLYLLDGEFYEVFHSADGRSINRIKLAAKDRIHLYCPSIKL